jgi:hypothetical protein
MHEMTDVQSFTTPTRPTFDPELAPVVEAIPQAFPPLSDETLPSERQAMAEGLPGMEPVDLTWASLHSRIE